jgi:ribosomal protein L7/L12
VFGLIFVIVFVIALGATVVNSNNIVVKARREGLYPQEGKGTLDDVKRLVKSGQKILAVRLYREMYKVGLREAKDAVEKIGVL